MSSPFSVQKWMSLFKNWRFLGEGLVVTFEVALLALSLALFLGIIFGVLSTSKYKVFKIISRIYVEFFQNTPLVIQIFFLYNGLPYVDIVLPVFAIGVLGVGVYHGAYISEVVRTGIQAVPKGQIESAQSQGFDYLQTMRYVILPQAVRIILPPLTNQAVNLIKNTSVLAMIAGGDLMYQADSWASTTLNYGPTYIITGALYFLLCFPLTKLIRKMELRDKRIVKINKNQEVA